MKTSRKASRPRVQENVATIASGALQLYPTASSSKCDAVFNLCFSSGTDASGDPLPLLSGPFVAQLSDTSDADSEQGVAWAALLTKLVAVQDTACVVAGLGAPRQQVADLLSVQGTTLTFANMPAPLPTACTANNLGTMQYLHVQVLGLDRAAAEAYVAAATLDAVTPLAPQQFTTLMLTFRMAGNVGSVTGTYFCMAPTPSAMYALSADNVMATVPCPFYAPFEHGVCDLAAYAPCGKQSPWITGTTAALALVSCFAILVLVLGPCLSRGNHGNHGHHGSQGNHGNNHSVPHGRHGHGFSSSGHTQW
jgi:hypothetical protein